MNLLFILVALFVGLRLLVGFIAHLAKAGVAEWQITLVLEWLVLMVYFYQPGGES